MFSNIFKGLPGEGALQDSVYKLYSSFSKFMLICAEPLCLLPLEYLGIQIAVTFLEGNFWIKFRLKWRQSTALWLLLAFWCSSCSYTARAHSQSCISISIHWQASSWKDLKDRGNYKHYWAIRIRLVVIFEYRLIFHSDWNHYFFARKSFTFKYFQMSQSSLFVLL
jgi:hypothetical protein